MIHATLRLLLRRHRLALALWLALLLPLGQLAATAHVLSHTSAQIALAAGAVPGEQGLDLAHCELCLTAAAIGSAAPAPLPDPLPLIAARHAAPAFDVGSVVGAALRLAYRSRAPPSSPR